ncbi:MAG: GYF domain-containing protein [Bdellovibrionales bacterium]|nr:GYF domain-containing protein [Bdellovibrionales bacterium]
MKLNYSIGLGSKLIAMVTVLIVLAIGVVVSIATDLFTEDAVTKAQESNRESAESVAVQVQLLFEDRTQRLTIAAKSLEVSDEIERADEIRKILKSMDDAVSFVVYRVGSSGQVTPYLTIVSESQKVELKLQEEKLVRGFQMKFIEDYKSFPLDAKIFNTSRLLGFPAYSLGLVAFPKGLAPDPKLARVEQFPEGTYLFRADFRQDTLRRFFPRRSLGEHYLVDRAGILFAHSDAERLGDLLAGKNLADSPITEQIRVSQLSNLQMQYDGPAGDKILASFRKVGQTGLSVVAEVPRKRALATLERVQYRSLLVMCVVVGVAFIFNFFFSESITRPIRLLFEATQKIVSGQFDVKLKVRTNDEVGALSKAFLNMAQGLKERDQLKGAFNKFHSKEVAKKLLSGEIKLGGEKKFATVFFSDIRNFTQMSEKMTPDQVVMLLNDYMTEMVKIIYKHNGVVDKYIGDAIMAIWGVPESTPQDSINAMNATLEMRQQLLVWNTKRRGLGLPEVQIGMALHAGEVLAGNIGSEERLEYTIIGDTVNQASRLEASTKLLKTDLVVSEEVQKLVQGHGFDFGPVLEIRAKGKVNLLRAHKVIGRLGADHKLETTLSEFEIAKVRSETSASFLGAAEEEKTSLGQLGSPALSSDEKWFVRDPQFGPEFVGPFHKDTLILKFKQKQVTAQAMVRRNETENPMPLTSWPELGRTVMPQIQYPAPMNEIQEQSTADEWYVAGPNQTTLGPYTLEELRSALKFGHVTRTTYVWNRVFDRWCYLYEAPGFERRGGSSAPPPPPAAAA